MPLKGKTKIELFNADSGKLEQCIEEENTLTGALAEIFQGIGRYGHGDSLSENVAGERNQFGFVRRSFNLTQWFGGMLCFDKNQDEEHPFGSYDSTIIASGVYGDSNNGANQIRGTYNETESVIDFENKQLTFVYDFATNQGNGNIKCISLVPWLGGYMNDGRARTRVDYYGMPVDECYQPTKADVGSGVGWNPLFGCVLNDVDFYKKSFKNDSGQDINYGLQDSNCRGRGTFDKVLEIDPINNWVLVARLEVSGYYLYVTFVRYNFASTEIDVWYGNGTSRAYDTSPAIQLEAVYDHFYTQFVSYDYENRIFYVVSAPPDFIRQNYEVSWSSRNSVDVSSVIKVYAIHVDPTISDNVESYTVDAYDVPNNTGMQLALQCYGYGHLAQPLQFFCYNGYMYVYGPNSSAYDTTSMNFTIFKIEIARPTNVVQIQTDVYSFMSYHAVITDVHDGKIYMTFGSNIIRVLNTYTNELYAYEELLNYDHGNRFAVPIRGHDALVAENAKLIGIRPNVLMTVNNITPVTKTAAQTMKISYTISG